MDHHTESCSICTSNAARPPYPLSRSPSFAKHPMRSPIASHHLPHVMSVSVGPPSGSLGASVWAPFGRLPSDLLPTSLGLSLHASRASSPQPAAKKPRKNSQELPPLQKAKKPKKAPQKIGHSDALQKGHTQKGFRGWGTLKKPFLSAKRGITRLPRVTSPHELPWWRPEGAPPRGEALGPSLGV